MPACAGMSGDVRSALCGKISMQPKLAVDRLELGRLDQLAMRHLHRMQRALQLLLPEGEEALQLGKLREQVVILPDVGLRQLTASSR